MRRPTNVLLISLWSLTCSPVVLGQINFEESNWHKEIGRYDDWYSRFDLARYTKEDFERAKAKFLRIASEKSNNEWTGSYRRQTMLGSAEITWHPNSGYVYAYVYHTLASLGYGRVKWTEESVSFVSERPGYRNHSFESKLIRVKLGERHLLVPEERMAEFAIWVVGREVPSGRRAKEIYTEDGFFWEKIDDGEKSVADIPSFPTAYRHLILQPIVSKLVAVGGLRIKRETSKEWGTTSIDHLRTLTLSAGKKQGVKVGMRFWIDELEEWVEIISVTATRSRASLERSFIDGREYCSRYENAGLTEFACRNPQVGMAARTRVDYF